jgi:hypothetical protein
MPADEPTGMPPVSAEAITRALSELRHHGHLPLMQQLEQTEPELMSYVWESLSDIHQHLLRLGIQPQATRRMYRHIQSLIVTVVLANRLHRTTD